MAVNGNTAIIGAESHDGLAGNNSGAAYVFVRSGSRWNQQQKLTAADASSGDKFGFSVSLKEDVAIVGAIAADAPGVLLSGAAYVYGRSESTWSEQQKLTASDAATSDDFGWSVGLGDGFVVVSARQDDDHGNSSGSAYVDAGGDEPFISNASPGDGSGRIYYSSGRATNVNPGGIGFVDSSDDSTDPFRAAGVSGTDPVWSRGIAAYDDEADVAYVLDGNNHSVRRVPASDPIDSNWGDTTLLSFNDPAGGRFDDAGNLYVSSTTAIYRIAPDESVTLVAAGFTNAAGIDLSEEEGSPPLLLVVDQATGEIYIVGSSTGEKTLVGSGFASPVAAVFSEVNGVAFYDVAEPTRIVRLPDPRVEFTLENPTRVLIHKHRGDDAYPSAFQVEDRKIVIEATLAGRTPGVPLYLRIIDPEDLAAYATSSAPDNKGAIETLSNSSPLTNAQGRVQTELTVTDSFAGDNYQIEVSLKPHANFKPIARSPVLTAWKRAYIEYDRMYEVGETVTQDSGLGANRVYVANPSTFSVGDDVHVLSGDNFATAEGEISKVAPGGIAADHIVLEDTLTNLYRESDGGPAPTNDQHPFSFVARVADGSYDAQLSSESLTRLYDDTFMEWLFVDGGSFLPLWPVVDSTTPATAAEWIQQRTVHFFKNLDAFSPPSASRNHVQLVAAARYDPQIVPYPVPPQDVIGGVSLGDLDATNWSWVFVKGILDGCTIVGCTAQQLDNILNDYKNHELAHQWQVNKPQNVAGHDMRTSWNSSQLCQMNESRDFSMPTKFHAELSAPFDLFCIRGHVDDLDQDGCSWPP